MSPLFYFYEKLMMPVIMKLWKSSWMTKSLASLKQLDIMVYLLVKTNTVNALEEFKLPEMRTAWRLNCSSRVVKTISVLLLGTTVSTLFRVYDFIFCVHVTEILFRLISKIVYFSPGWIFMIIIEHTNIFWSDWTILSCYIIGDCFWISLSLANNS